jgi:hypothetical protein
MPSPTVVVDDFDVVGVTLAPDKADTPLVIDPDTVLAFPAAPETLQAVTGRNPQGIEASGSVDHVELRNCSPLHVLGKLSREPASE